jgi:hypothetical protein
LNTENTYAVRARAYDTDTEHGLSFSLDNLRLTNVALARALPENPTWLANHSDWKNPQNWSPAGVPVATWDANVISAAPGPKRVDVNDDTSVNKLTIGGLSSPMVVSLNAGTMTVAQSVTIGLNGQLSLSGGSLATPRIELRSNGNLSLPPGSSGFDIPIQSAGGTISIDALSASFDLASPVTYIGPTNISVRGTANFTGQQAMGSDAAVILREGSVRMARLHGPNADLTVVNGASLESSRIYTRNLTVGGTLRVQPSENPFLSAVMVGLPSYPGAYTQAPGGRVIFTAAGNAPEEYGSMGADTLRLAGSMAFELKNGFTPQLGQSFDLIWAGFREGDFDAYVLPVLPGSAAFQLGWSDPSKLTLNIVESEPIDWISPAQTSAWSDPNNWSTGLPPATHSGPRVAGNSNYDKRVTVDVNATVHRITIASSQAAMDVIVPEGKLLLATDRIVVEDGGRLDIQNGNVVSSAIELAGGTLRGIGTADTAVVSEHGRIEVNDPSGGLTLTAGLFFTANGAVEKAGLGTLIVQGSVVGEGDISVTEGTLVMPAATLDSLSISGASSLVRIELGSGTVVLKSLTFASSAAELKAVPEPSTLALIATGVLAIVVRRSRRLSQSVRRRFCPSLHALSR